MVEIRFHRRVQSDLNEALAYYREISATLADDFFDEFSGGVAKVRANPGVCHFDACGLRRCNLERFPYHFLYDLRQGYVRVWVLRHEKRKPEFGTGRF
jgi:toxin ParE1/3/4